MSDSMSYDCKVMFEGRHSFGGRALKDISRPSRDTVLGSRRDRSVNQILRGGLAVSEPFCHIAFFSTYPVPVPTSAILKFGLLIGMDG